MRVVNEEAEDFTAKMRHARTMYRVLTRAYPNVHCELDYQTPFQLLVATVLSAQCTDKRVNQVTPMLFKRYGTVRKMAAAPILEIEELIHSVGFFHTKAQNIKGLSERLISDFGAKVPPNLDQLVTLPGVGRKTANVVLGHAFDIPGITVDTHFGRLSRRFGWTDSLDPVKVEHEVGALIPQSEWTNLSQRMIWHGRRICHSRKPACGACPLAELCPSFGVGEVDKIKASALDKSDEEFR